MSGISDHLEKINTFRVVAELGSLHKASRQLRLSQPSISSSIKILEDAAGLEFFIRSSKGMSLTPEGKVLFEFAQKLHGSLQQLDAELVDSADGNVGILRVGFYESIAIYLWPAFFRRHSKKLPKLRLHLTTGRSTSLIDKVINRDLDMVVSVEPPFHKALFSVPLFSDSFGFYGSKEICARTNAPLILFSAATMRGEVSIGEYLSKHGHPVESGFEVESFEAAREMAIQSLGLAVLPHRVALRSAGDSRELLVRKRFSHEEAGGFGSHSVYVSCLGENRQKGIFQKVISELQVQCKSPPAGFSP